jgi:nucleotide-binding universal stress UspA family protein
LDWQIRKAEAEMYLQGITSKILRNGIETHYALREGRTAENIVDFAHQENIDLVVLSTHGASGLSRWNMSSVVTKVLEKIYLPVLLIRAYQEAGVNVPVSSGKDAAGQPPLQQEPVTRSETEENLSPVRQETASTDSYSPYLYRRILLPIDSSRRAECALPAATTLARGEKGEQVTIIMGAVINPPDLPIPSPYPEEIHQLIDRFMQLSRSAVENYMNDLSQRLQLACETRIIVNENISAALHEMADQENVDLIVLCAHGQTGGTNWPYGSVARNYIEHGTRSVLVIQDVPHQQLRPTAAEIAAEKYGRR